MKIYNLRNTREDMNMTQKEIGEIFNVQKSTVCEWEKGVQTIPLKKLIKYSNHFNYSLDYLFGKTKTNNENYLPLDIDLNIIGTNLRKIRKKNHLTQQEIANRLGTSQGSYAQYENSRYLIPTTFLYNLYQIYGNSFSFDEILGRKRK